MSSLTRNTSGRVVLVALAIGLIGAMMTITLFPANAADVIPTSEGRISGDACDVLGLPGESFSFDVPKGSANDQTRVFDETYGLENGSSVEVFLPSNRSYVNFEMTGEAWATAVVLFGRNGQGEATLYDYSSVPFLTDDEGLVSLSTGNVKRVTLCYESFEYLFLCGIPITEADPAGGLDATFVRPEGTTGCNEAGVPDDTPKFGNIDFSATDEVIQFTPGGAGDAVFVGELVFDGGGPYSILQIDVTDDGEDDFEDMEWYSGAPPVFEYDEYDNLIGATFSCSSTADWCILDGSIDPNGITWIIGGDAVDPRFR